MDGYLSYPAGGHGPEATGNMARLRQALRRVGALPIVWLGFLLELGWAFVGSSGFGLGASPAAGRLQAYTWLGGAVVIAGTAAAAAILARAVGRKED